MSSLTVIVPAHNASATLEECLRALIGAAGSPDCVTLVDDASTDGTPGIAERLGVRVLRMTAQSGPAAARNYGVERTEGDLILFVDADVVIRPDVLERVRAAFAEQPELGALFGSYDTEPRAPNLVSQYRNLMHHHMHQVSQPNPSTFWAGLGAVRREAFQAVGGFDVVRFPRPSIEDIELGYRLTHAGYRIRLDRHIQGTHLKRWTLTSVVRTDLFCRAAPWSRLLLAGESPAQDLNIQSGQKLCVALVFLACLAATLAPFNPLFLCVALAALAPAVLLNRGFYLFLARVRGPLFALACVPLHLLYFLYSGFGYGLALLGHLGDHPRRVASEPAV